MMNLSKKLTNPIFKTVQDAAEELNYPTYVVGGWVRDILLKRNQGKTDIDFVCVGSSLKLAKKIKEKLNNKSSLKVYENFGTAVINTRNENYEFVGSRKESYRRNSRKPIIENGSLEDDQNRRDFTINAMAVQINKKNYGKFLDPFNGLCDLKNQLIRTPVNPEQTYSDDPLRMMRAIRFATQLNFQIEKRSYDAIKKQHKRLSIISQERITEELNKIIISDRPSIGFKMLLETNLLNMFFPKMTKLCGVDIIDNKAHKDNFFHTLEVLDNISKKSKNLWLRWAAILHDIAKPDTKKFDKKNGWTFHGHEFLGAKIVPEIFKSLKLPLNHKMKYVQKLVLLHLRPIVLAQEIVTDSAVRRLLFDAGDNIDDLMLLCDADITYKNQKKIKKYHNNFQIVRKKLIEVEKKDQIRNFQPPIDGNEIMKTFNLSAGKEIGILKNSVKNAILDGKISNTKKEALIYLFKKAKEINLKLN